MEDGRARLAVGWRLAPRYMYTIHIVLKYVVLWCLGISIARDRGASVWKRTRGADTCSNTITTWSLDSSSSSSSSSLGHGAAVRARHTNRPAWRSGSTVSTGLAGLTDDWTTEPDWFARAAGLARVGGNCHIWRSVWLTPKTNRDQERTRTPSVSPQDKYQDNNNTDNNNK